MPVPGVGIQRSPAPDYSLQFQTFSQRDCYDAVPRRSLSRPALALSHAPGPGIAQEGYYGSSGIKRHQAGKRIVDSPPDGLNLGAWHASFPPFDRVTGWSKAQTETISIRS